VSSLRTILLGMLAAALVSAACAGDGSRTIGTLDAEATVTLLAERPDVVVLDVRTPEEYAQGNVEGSQLLDFRSGAFAREVETLDRDLTYVVYCRTGNRSGQAVDLMDELGFSEVYDAGAYDSLARAGAPVGASRPGA
jgi:phage shock protein E